MVRGFLEHRTPLVLWQRPPFGRLADGNERAAGRFGSVEGRLEFCQAILFCPRDVALVAPNATKNPGHLRAVVGQAALYKEPRSDTQGLSCNGSDARDEPRTGRATEERVQLVVHGVSNIRCRPQGGLTIWSSAANEV